MLKSLELKDFLKHDRLSLTFEPGVNLITGPNGSGKTTIFDAISICLFGKFTRTIPKKLFENKDFEVILTLQDGNVIKLNRKGWHVNDKRFDKKMDFLEEFSYEKYFDIIVASQGNCRWPFNLPPKDRTEVISDILQITTLQNMFDNFFKKFSRYTNFDDILNVTIGQLDRTNQYIQNKYSVFNERVHLIENKLQKIQIIKEQYEKLYAQFNALLEQYKMLFERYKPLHIQKKYKQLLEHYKALYQQYDQLKHIYNDYQYFEKYADIWLDLFTIFETSSELKNIVKLLQQAKPEQALSDFVNLQYDEYKQLKSKPIRKDWFLKWAKQYIINFKKSDIYIDEFLQQISNKYSITDIITAIQCLPSYINTVDDLHQNLHIFRTQIKPQLIKKYKQFIAHITDKIVFYQNEIARQNIYYEQINSLKSQIKACYEQLKCYKEKYSHILTTSFDQYISKLKQYQEELTNLKMAKQQINEIQKWLNEHNDDINFIKDCIETYKFLERTLPELRKQIYCNFEQYFYYILSKLSPMIYDKIKLTEDMDIETDILISGGQQTAIALAMRLAIAQISLPVKLLLIDEPEFLDNETLFRLMNVLNDSGFQILLISHYEVLTQIAPHIISLK